MTSSVVFPKTLGIFPVLKSTLGRYYSYSKPFFPISQKFAPYKHFFIFLFLRSRYRGNWESGRIVARDPWSVIPVTITTQKSSNHHGARLPNPIPYNHSKLITEHHKYISKKYRIELLHTNNNK